MHMYDIEPCFDSCPEHVSEGREGGKAMQKRSGNDVHVEAGAWPCWCISSEDVAHCVVYSTHHGRIPFPNVNVSLVFTPNYAAPRIQMSALSKFWSSLVDLTRQKSDGNIHSANLSLNI